MLQLCFVKSIACASWLFTFVQRSDRRQPCGLLCASALLGCISVVTWHAGCIENMRVSLVKCRSCRTGCSCTAETGICTVPGGAVRNTWGTAPVEVGEKTNKHGCPSANSLAWCLFEMIYKWQVNPPVSWPCACETCMAEVPWEKALSTASPSVRADAGVYITVWGLGYIMWPATDVGTDEVTMVAGRRAGDGGGGKESSCHTEGKRLVHMLASRWHLTSI